jgi:hypothetical protein
LKKLVDAFTQESMRWVGVKAWVPCLEKCDRLQLERDAEEV